MKKRHIFLVLYAILGGLLISANWGFGGISVVRYPMAYSGANETRPILGHDGLSYYCAYEAFNTLANGSPLPADVWYNRLIDGQPFSYPIQVTYSDRDDLIADAWGDYILYLSMDSVDSNAGRLFLHKISTGIRFGIATSTNMRDSNPQMDGSTVLWLDNGTLWQLELPLEYSSELPDPEVLAGPNPAVTGFAIGDRYIVWSQANQIGGGYQILALERGSSTPQQVATTFSPPVELASDGEWVAWAFGTNVSSNENLILWHLGLGDHVMSFMNGLGTNPRLNENHFTYDWLDPNSGLSRIYLADLNSYLTDWQIDIYPISPSGVNAYDSDIYGNVVAYVVENESMDVYTARFTITEGDTPVPDAGDPQVIEATSADGAQVTLDGSGSSDPDNDPLTYEWSGSFETVSGVSATVTLPLGVHEITLSVTDPTGASASDTVQITIQDTTPPQLAPAEVKVESPTGSPLPVSYSVAGNDLVNGTIPADCAPPSGSTFELGATPVTCTAIDSSGNSASAVFYVFLTTDLQGAGSGSVSSTDGGTVATEDGTTSIEIPPGAVSSDTQITITETGIDYELSSNLGNGIAVYGMSIEPDGTEFSEPVTITLGWVDAEPQDGRVDGTNIKEENLIITKDNVAITDRCRSESGPLVNTGAECDTTENWFKVQVTSLSDFALAYVDEDGPVISGVVADPNPAPVNMEIGLTALVDDSITGNTDIFWAEYFVDDLDQGTVIMEADDGGFDNTSEVVVGTIGVFPEPGVHKVCIRGWDERRNNPGIECILLAVYDPSAGFVTGGGWIDSPAGAYHPENHGLTYPSDYDPTGKANFGFVSKYQKGSNVPTGNTEFQFNAAEFEFRSDAYEWLVINAERGAQFKGSGFINGLEELYDFKLWAVDADSGDRFRIKIWWEDMTSNENVIYDNGINADGLLEPDEEGAAQAIGGGSIVIHRK